MRPILLQGHSRALTMVRYNREGDLIFSCSKDNNPTVWYSNNGERLGTYKGHSGAVWCLDVSQNTHNLVTGSADPSAKVWDVETGKLKNTVPCLTSVRSVSFSPNNNLVAVATDAQYKNPPLLNIYDTRSDDIVSSIEVKPRIGTVIWDILGDYIYAGNEDGEISMYTQDLTVDKSAKLHSGLITDIQPSKDRSHFISASKDYKAKIWSYELKELKVFETDRPVNSASMSSIRDHVLLGGGQDAQKVTTTSTRSGKFEARFFHKIYQHEIARVGGHFGPINTLSFHPKGTSFASGGEDGYIRVHHFDQSYFDFKED